MSMRKASLLGVLLVVLCPLAFSVPAAASPPFESQFVEVFDDVNPCTEGIHTVTISVTEFVHVHGSRVLAPQQRTITTSNGFIGRGSGIFLMNGQTLLLRASDILENDAADRILAQFVLVIDLASDTLRVDKFELTCLGG
jgi:hypothetical protein